jgi:Predicted ATPase of the ABC class
MNAVYPTNSVKKVNDSKVGWSNKNTLSTSSLQMHNGLGGSVGWKIIEQSRNEAESQFCSHIGATMFSISSEIFTIELRRIAVADYLLRNFCSSLLFLSSSGHNVPISPPNLDQHIIERSQLKISAEDGTVSIEFKVQKQSADDARLFLDKTLPLLLSTWSSSSIANNSQLAAHWQCVEDQCALREMISSQGISFVADGSVLPRAGTTR